MTDSIQYEKGCSPSAIQRKYSLTYEQGYELAERLKKTQELELELRKENAQLKELLKECRECVDENLEFSKSIGRNRIQPRNKGLLKRIDEALK